MKEGGDPGMDSGWDVLLWERERKAGRQLILHIKQDEDYPNQDHRKSEVRSCLIKKKVI